MMSIEFLSMALPSDRSFFAAIPNGDTRVQSGAGNLYAKILQCCAICYTGEGQLDPGSRMS
jgi:hypothetical protein